MEGTRGTKADPVTGKQMLFSFLTTDAGPGNGGCNPITLASQRMNDNWF